MIARITRLLLLIQALTAALLFVLAVKVWHIDKLALALIVSIGPIFLLRLLITANNFFIAWVYHSETPAAHRLDWRQMVRLFIGEFNATIAISSWTMPFNTFTKHIAKKPVGLPILLIHGYGCNSGYWHEMSMALKQAHITHHAIDLEPVLGDIDDYVPLVRCAVETLCKETGYDNIIIVAHSMGGLATRAYLRDHGGAHIAKVITIGTPHHGTGVANYGIGINCRQMRWVGSAKDGASSDWLQRLAASEDKNVYALFVSIYSHHDNIISPQISSHLPGARNIEFHGIGHVALARKAEIQAQVIEEIFRTTQPAVTAATV